MKILNLYAGIGGNRKLWGDEHDITAIELVPKIAKIYQDFFPNDKVIVANAHAYLLEHYKEFDFIWSSPPCPTHSKLRKQFIGTRCGAKPIFPDMKLYEEIIFLRYFFEGKYCVENVISYYKPLIRPTESGSHYFWTNFHFSPINNIARNIRNQDITDIGKNMGFDLSSYELPYRFRRDMINNLIIPELGLHILNESQRIVQPELFNKL